MANFRSLEQIILGMLDYLRSSQPDLDTKPGTIARDLIDAPASELSKLYIELRNIQNLQSLTSSVGRNLDQLSRNFGLSRGTGGPASGLAVLTLNTLNSNIFIKAGTIFSARNGITYKTISDSAFDTSKSNIYKANAIRIRQGLDLAGISDVYALELAVEAQNPGLTGNVGKFSLITQNVPGVSSVTNVEVFSGGTNVEGDDAFRSRILSVFSSSSIGTILGYINAVTALSSVSDVLAVEPGDPLMIRDGTDITTNESGEKIIVTSGTGGKVDIYILGTILRENAESYIFKDQSGKSDPTDSANDHILGQRNINPLLDFQQRRKLLMDKGTLPFQPVDNVLSVVGSLSGPNFIAKYTDTDGQTKGSYEIIKDTASFAGSPFGFDKLNFISNTISLPEESISKGAFNGEDALDYTDVREVSSANQSVAISSEHGTVSTKDRALVTIKHTPISIVSSIFNYTTGQKYRIETQNVDGVSGEPNTTGRIKISGGTLPTTNDVLQINYTWNHVFDDNIDFDNLIKASITRTTQDSIDWGFSNRILNEEAAMQYSLVDGYHFLLTHPISRFIGANAVVVDTVVDSDANRKVVVTEDIINIESVKSSSGKEIFFTQKQNGSFSGKEITLPTDSIYSSSETLTVRYNYEDVFNSDGYGLGSYQNNVVYLQDGAANAGSIVYANYVAAISSLLPSIALLNLPAIGSQNEFIINNNVVGNQPVSNTYDINGSVDRSLRFSPTYLKLDFQGILTLGMVVIKGVAYTKIEQVITVRRNGLKLDISEAIKQQLSLNTIPTTGFVALLHIVQKVTVSDGRVSSFDFTYDTLNYEVKNIELSNASAFENAGLLNYEVQLSETEENTASSPVTGDKLKVILYWADDNAVERIVVTTSGSQYSKYKYAFVESIVVDSGFVGLSGAIEGSVSMAGVNQPAAGSGYFSTYTYKAPKEGERITINYTYNRLITDATLALEAVRPVTADVLAKQAQEIPLDVSMKIVALATFTGGESNLVSNVTEAVSVFLTSQGLNTTIDNDDIVSLVHSVSGVDRVTMTKFNLEGLRGLKQSLSSDRSKHFSVGTIEVVVEGR